MLNFELITDVEISINPNLPYVRALYMLKCVHKKKKKLYTMVIYKRASCNLYMEHFDVCQSQMVIWYKTVFDIT